MQLLGKLNGELVAVLQVRGAWNLEKNAPESFPGGCQGTAFGGLEEGESLIQALLREVGEELGDEFVALVQTAFGAGQFIELVSLDTPEKQIITFGMIVEEDVVKKLLGKERSPSSGGFRAIRRNQVGEIANLKTFDKNVGVVDQTITALFPDAKESVLLAFEKLS